MSGGVLMRTSKEVATISYNSEDFLKEQLKSLYRRHVICDWMFIKHQAEEDERKDHIHLWIKPNTLIDTMEIQNVLTEFNPDDSLHPLKCIDFRRSSVDDWILYALHDREYLLTKGECRQYVYEKENIIRCDDDTFEDLYYHAYHGSKFAQERVQRNIIFDFNFNKAELIKQGRVPLGLASQLLALDSLQRTYRGYHENHEMKEEIEKEIEKEKRVLSD